MKVNRMGCWLVVTAVAFLGMSVWAADPAKPGCVKVEWSETDGETWTVEGLADRESGRPMARDTVFAICSNTKPVTSVLVLTFVEEGVLNLDDPVSKYFPEFADVKFKGQPAKRPILLRHLLTHLSGLAYEAHGRGRKSDMTPYREQAELAAKAPLRKEPGEGYQYCGLGFQVMGAILEQVTGRKVHELMKERVFDPLGMTDATFYPDERLLARVAVPYYYPPEGGAPVRWWFDNRWSVPLDDSARTALLSGGLFCTVVDYLKFSQMMARKGLGANGRRILSEATFEKYLLTRQTPPGDDKDASFDVHFNKDRTAGSKGGLLATHATWNWGSRSCKVVFVAKSPYPPKGMKAKLDATGFGGKKTTFVVSGLKVSDGRASCRVANGDDRHGVATAVLTVNGKVVEKKRVELAIGEEKPVAFAADVKPTDKIDVKVR